MSDRNGSEDISKTQADRAGQLLRRARLDPQDVETLGAELEAARETVGGYRLRFVEPHLSVAERLREIVTQQFPDGAVAARLKRYERIVDKLIRPAHAAFSDAGHGGCRAVLPSRLDGSPGAFGLDAIRNTSGEIQKQWPLAVDPDDSSLKHGAPGTAPYISRLFRTTLRSKSSCGRFARISGAELSETLARHTGFRLADGEGPPELLQLLRLTAEIYATNDRGEVAASSLVAEYERLLPALSSILKFKPPEAEA